MKIVLFVLLGAFCAQASAPPAILRPHNGDEAMVHLADGTAKKLYLGRDGYGGAIDSPDGGKSWLEEKPRGARWASKAFVDHDGQLHGFMLVLREERKGRRIAIDRFIDVWHFKTSGPDRRWEKAKVIQQGWNGSIVDNAVQLPGGRIVQPSQDWVPGSKPGPPTGNGYAQMLYSDDGGETWARSNPITAPVYDGYNGANFGACEPSIVLRDDGSLWALMRTQTGFLYESSSRDGANWTPAKPSTLHSSTGPPALLKLPDKRLLVFWNNCEMPQKVGDKGVYAGRDALHGAISDDDGRTWRGFREVILDSRRHQSPPKKGDRGVAYPYAAVTKDGLRAEVTAGHAPGRVVVGVDPEWLLENERTDDFSHGLENWSVFTPFGEVVSWWRDRATGAQLVENSEKPGAKALELRKRDDKDADGATWNFPASRAGEMHLRIKFAANHGGAKIALTDRFFEPTDSNADARAVYLLEVRPDGMIVGADASVPSDRWIDIVLNWSKGAIFLDGEKIGDLARRHPSEHGVSYLHLRSTADGPAAAGFQVGSVSARRL